MAKKPDAAADLSVKLLQALDLLRSRATYPTTLQNLCELADTSAPADLAFKAAAKAPFAERAIVAIRKNLAAPAALREDLQQFADSVQVLEFALTALYAAGAPPWPLAKLGGQLDKELRPAFEEAVNARLQDGSLAASVGVINIRGKSSFYLKRQPPTDVALAEKLIAVLRQRGPLPLNELVQAADPAASAELVKKAIALTETQPAAKKYAAAPLLLREDLERGAGSAAVLAFALRLVCTEAAPTTTPTKLKSKLDKSLQEPFERALQQRIAAQTLPDDVEWLPHAKVLHPLWLPLPPPADIDLAQRLVRVLEAQRRLGAASYPVRLPRLIELTGLKPKAAVLKKALASEPFVSRALPLLPKLSDTPVALLDDLAECAAQPELLQFLLENGAAQAFSLTELKGRLARAAQEPFRAALERHMDAGALPAGVGWVRYKKERLLFRLHDVHGQREQVVAKNGEPAGDFAPTFAAAFAALDRAGGSLNYVSLVDLRRAVPVARAAFDAGLRQLCDAGQYALRAAEGRHGVSEEQRAAGIAEEGALLLFVSRRSP